MAKGYNGLVELSSFYEALDDEFKAQLEQEVNGASLFNLLKLPNLDLFHEFYDCIMVYYNAEGNCFEFGDHRLTVTLEDVLYITGLPIRGNAVICEKSRDHEAFLRVFNIDYPNPNYKKMPLQKLKEFAIDVNNDLVRRKIVALLVVQSCVVTPSFMGHGITSMYIQLFEELDKVESYAWGAALLSFLYSGLEKRCNGTKMINGNLWVLLSFFLIRIPKLREAFGVDLALAGYKGPLLHHILDRIKNRRFVRRSNYVVPQMTDILENLSDDDIAWQPYLPSMLPARVEGQAEWGTLLVPLFCNNYVVYHMPHLVAKQFNVFEKYHVSKIKWKAVKIKTMENAGRLPDFVKFYEDHLRTWAEQKRAQDYMPRFILVETETPGPSRAREHMSSTVATEHRIHTGCGETMSATATDGKIYNAFSAMKRLGIREENVKLVLSRLLNLYDKNWQLIEEDNYRTLVDAIVAYENKNAEREMEPPRKKQQTGNGVGKALSRDKGKSVVCVTESDPDTCDGGNSPQSASSSDICSGSSSPSCDEAVVVAKRERKKVFHEIEDIAKGAEEVQISLVDEVGNEDLPRFVYFPHSVSFQSAQVRVSLARISDEDCCSDCKGDCLSSSAPCECAGSTGGEYAYTTEGLLTWSFLQKCTAKNFIKECWKKCGCDMKCGNRVVQRGITRKLQVFLTSEGKGWGLRALEALPKGAFVCEYVGEILTNIEFRERNRRSRADNEKHIYRVLLDDCSTAQENDLNDNDALCLDATNCGNVARFINHRCGDANLIDVPVEVETPDRHYYHVALFTKRRVDALEELTWDYGIEFWEKGCRVKKAFECRCGSKDCRDVRPRT